MIFKDVSIDGWPSYEHSGVDVFFSECSKCGALVRYSAESQAIHVAWHEKIENA